MKKVIGYVRVSTDKQDLQRQKVLITKYCESMGYSLVRFIGEKVSGAKSERSGLAELLTVSKDEADLIVVSELSRISRQDDIMNVISQLNSIRVNGLDLYILDTNTAINAADNMDGLEVMKLVFKAVGNADERRKITERMRTGRYTKLVKNPYAYVGGQIPFGFKTIDNPNYNEKSANDKEPKTILIPDEEQVKVLEMMFTKIANGFTLHRLAKYMIDNGMTYFKSKKFVSYQGIISEIIHNPIYKGERQYSGETFIIKPVINVELFEAANEALNSNRWMVSTSNNHFNPLKGILYCSCGRSLYFTNCKDYNYYKCSKKLNDAKEVICNNKGLRAETAFKAIWIAARTLLYQDKFNIKTTEKENLLQNDINIVKSALVTFKNEVKAKESEKEDIINKIQNLTNLSLISVFEKKFDSLESEIAELNEKITKKEIELNKLESKYNEIKQISIDEKLDSLDLEAKSELLHKVVEKAVWYSDTLRKGFLDVTYKNGYREVIMIQTDKTHRLIMQLPSTFTLNPLTRKVGAMMMKPTANKFSLEQEYTEYSFKEFLDNFGEVEEWIIEREIVNGFTQKKGSRK